MYTISFNIKEQIAGVYGLRVVVDDHQMGRFDMSAGTDYTSDSGQLFFDIMDLFCREVFVDMYYCIGVELNHLQNLPRLIWMLRQYAKIIVTN